jgi:hypothetical protein
MAERHFGDCAAALLDDVEQQIFMFGRIDFVVSARQHSDCAGIERHAMRRLIDAACESRCDGKSALPRSARDGLRELQSCAGCIARADDADHRLGLDIEDAPHAQQRGASSIRARRGG